MKRVLLTFWLLVLLALSACGPPPVPPTAAPSPTAVPVVDEEVDGDGVSSPQFETSPAAISQVEVLILESFPVQINVAVQGMLSGSCSTLGDISVTPEGNNFVISIMQTTALNVPCTMNLDPFTENIPLDVAGLAAGDYTVTVNESEPQSFTLAMDNVFEEEATESKPETLGQAYVTAVTITTVDETNRRATVQIQGELADGCTVIEDISVSNPVGNLFVARISTQRTAELVCTQALVPFTQTIVLELAELAPGEYEVEAGGVVASFRLGTADNNLTLPQPVPAPTIDFQGDLASVDSVTVRVDAATQIATVEVTGLLPDGCPELSPTEVLLVGSNALSLGLVRSVPRDMLCTAVITPFEKLITIDVSPLAPGEYSLGVNGVTAVFTIE